MTPEQLKQAAVVMLAAAEGRKVQLRLKGCTVAGWLSSPEFQPVWNWKDYEYRIVPETVKSRRYLYHAEGFIGVGVVFHDNVVGTAMRTDGFIRWIDTEWQEHEV